MLDSWKDIFGIECVAAGKICDCASVSGIGEGGSIVNMGCLSVNMGGDESLGVLINISVNSASAESGD